MSSSERSAHLHLTRVVLSRQLPQFTAEFTPGVSAIVLQNETDAALLLGAISGICLPLRGRIRYGNQDPARTPALRSQIGLLLPSEDLPGGISVEEYLRLVRTHQGRREDQVREDLVREDQPSSIFLEEFLSRSIESLTASEKRRVALGVALNLPAPQILALYDPLQSLPRAHLEFALSRIRQCAEGGTIVVCVLPTARAASVLTQNVLVIENGTAREPHPRAEACFLLDAERPRQLAALLSEESAVLSTRLDPLRPAHLLIEVTDAILGAQAITQAVLRSQCQVRELCRVSLPSLSKTSEVRS